MSFSLECKKCKIPLKLDDFAIDKTCQNKHVFYFECPQCDDFMATAMVNIPEEQWPDFVPADKLDNLIKDFNVAMKRDQ